VLSTQPPLCNFAFRAARPHMFATHRPKELLLGRLSDGRSLVCVSLECCRVLLLETMKNEPPRNVPVKIPEAWSFRFCDYVNKHIHKSFTLMTAADSHLLSKPRVRSSPSPAFRFGLAVQILQIRPSRLALGNTYKHFYARGHGSQTLHVGPSWLVGA
jgi:hypothetical protein